MRIPEDASSREPIVFNPHSAENAEHFDPDSELPYWSSFQLGRASFGNPIYDAVACSSSGIDVDGQLNMVMVQAAEAVAKYVDGKHGQPLLLMETASEPGQSGDFAYMRGYVARLATKGPLVGVFGHNEGIAVTGSHARPHLYTDENNIYHAQYFSEVKTSTIPLAQSEFKLGMPGAGTRNDYVYRQDIAAGEEILPLIDELFSEPNRYRFYMDMIGSLLRNCADQQDWSVLDTIIAEPYLSTATGELGALDRIDATLRNYHTKVTQVRLMAEGMTAQANLDLIAAAEEYDPDFQGIPRTHDSYPMPVTNLLNGPYGEQMKQRYEAIDYQREPLRQLTLRANQLARDKQIADNR